MAEKPRRMQYQRCTHHPWGWYFVRTPTAFCGVDDGDNIGEVLNWPIWSWSRAARDKRVCAAVSADGQRAGLPGRIYMYQLRVAVHNYGPIVDIESLVTAFRQMKSEFEASDLTIDHINGDCEDDRIWNLAVMPRSLNTKKGNMIKRILLPYTWISVHADDGFRIICGSEEKSRFVLADTAEKYVDFLGKYCQDYGSDPPGQRFGYEEKVGYDLAGEQCCQRLLKMDAEKFERI